MSVDRVTHLVRQLEGDILSGKLPAGRRLPSERDLSSEHGVSRSVVREALGHLESLGLLSRMHGSGTRVETPNGRQATVGYQRFLQLADLRPRDLGEVRLPLETAIAALAAARRTDEHLARLEKAQAALANRRGSLESHAKADLEFHATLAAATGNPLFQLILEPIQQLLIESRRRTLGRYGAELAHQHHERIFDAVRSADSEAAEESMRRHIQANLEHLREVES
jgi:GntR family transcriptional repressor for pyruvate dehydrogenase complex